MALHIEKVNEVFIRVKAENGILLDLREHFTFIVPGHQFMPSFQNKMWDGKIRLLNHLTGQIYAGLLPKVYQWAKDRGIKVTISPDLYPSNDVSKQMLEDFIADLEGAFVPRDYQFKAVHHAVNFDRALFLSPTASGKSFIIWLLTRFHMELDRRVLIIVPTVTLVKQMAGDFREYNNDVSEDCHLISAGADKNSDKPITVTTWQSVYKMKAPWFAQFDVIIGDEAHNFKSKSLIKILENTPTIKFRYGFTGTLDGSKTNKLVLEGLFGSVVHVEKTRNLIDKGTLADFDIKAICLQYPDEDRKHVSNQCKKYQEEVEWINASDKRNKYLCKLAHSLPGNTLILINYIEKHGDILVEMLKKTGNKPVYYIHGNIDADERERIRHIVENSDECILVASFGSFATGSNIKRLHNMILASSTKSIIRLLQSIGRVLRKGNGKESSTLYDIVDDLRWKNRENYGVTHFKDRVDIYDEQGFKYKIHNVELK